MPKKKTLTAPSPHFIAKSMPIDAQNSTPRRGSEDLLGIKNSGARTLSLLHSIDFISFLDALDSVIGGPAACDKCKLKGSEGGVVEGWGRNCSNTTLCLQT